MKILSRPSKAQPCEDVVLDSIKHLYNANAGQMQGQYFGLNQYVYMVRLVFNTLERAKVVHSCHLKPPIMKQSSTFEVEEWTMIAGFTGDGKEWYTLELAFTFRRA